MVELLQDLDPTLMTVAIGHKQDPLQLTQRERQVLQLICDGLTNQEIGNELHIADTTARGHVKTIMQKLDVDRRAAAAAEAIRRQLAC